MPLEISVKITLPAVFALALALAGASPARAQLPVSFGISAGATVPVGDFGELNV